MLDAFQTEEDKNNNTAQVIAVYVKKVRGIGIAKLLMYSLRGEVRNTHIPTAKLSVNVE